MTDHRQQCEATREVMSLLISSDASVTDLTMARQHLSTCAGCRRYQKRLQDDADRLQSFAAAHADRVADLTLQAITTLPDRLAPGARNIGHWTRRLAAVAAVAVFLLVFFQTGTPSFDAWAEVMATVRRTTSSQFRLRDMTGGNIEARQTYSARGTAHRTYEDGKLVEALFVDFESGSLLYLAYPLKLAARMTMTDELVEDHRRHDPGNTFQFLQEEYAFTDLGRRRIDGRTAVGVRVDDARFLAERLEHAELTLWADPETRLPVRFDVRGDVVGARRQKHVRFDQFIWDEPLPEDEFHPAVPADFTIHDGGHLAVDEAHALDGLRLFGRIVGRYPTVLAYESLKVELWRSDGARRRDVGAMVVDMFRIRLASSFYGSLVRAGREVLYLGDRVRPGDTDRVLLRWRLDDGRYRVVFGDLAVREMSGAELLELEGS